MNNLLLFISLLLTVSAYSQKKKIAVFSFEDKSISNYSDIGNGLADMITTELVKNGAYSVIERQQLASLLNEYSLGMSGLLDSESVIEAGKMIGVEYAVFGAVTEYGVHVESKSGGAFGVSISSTTSMARVGLDIRMVNTATGEIIAADNVVETVEKTKRKVLPGYSNHNFDETLVGEAARNAVKKVVSLLTDQVEGQKTSSKKTRPGNLEYKVLMVNNGEVYITTGGNQGVLTGDLFSIVAKGEELIDEESGASYGFLEEEIALIEVVNPTISGGKASKCKIVSGEGVEKGMTAKKVN